MIKIWYKDAFENENYTEGESVDFELDNTFTVYYDGEIVLEDIKIKFILSMEG